MPDDLVQLLAALRAIAPHVELRVIALSCIRIVVRGLARAMRAFARSRRRGMVV